MDYKIEIIKWMVEKEEVKTRNNIRTLVEDNVNFGDDKCTSKIK